VPKWPALMWLILFKFSSHCSPNILIVDCASLHTAKQHKTVTTNQDVVVYWHRYNDSFDNVIQTHWKRRRHLVTQLHTIQFIDTPLMSSPVKRHNYKWTHPGREYGISCFVINAVWYSLKKKRYQLVNLQLLTELIIYTTDKSSTKWKLAANSRHSKR